jgi:hypothetical protein
MLPLRPSRATRKWGAPAGCEQNVGGLHVATEVHSGMQFLVSKWEPTPDELARLNAGAPIVLGLSVPQHPVVFLSVGQAPE